MTDKEKQVSIRVYLDESLRNLVKSKAARLGKTLNEAVNELLVEYTESERDRDKVSKNDTD
jgi:hypothetical protein